MNFDQITAVLRVIVPTLCAWLAARGFSGLSDAGTVATVTTAVVAVGASIWSIYIHTDASKLKSAARVDPGIQVVVPQQVADASPAISTVIKDVPNVTTPNH
jgi:hypothetical protein